MKRYDGAAMRMTFVFAVVVAVVSAAVLGAQALPPTVEFRHQGMKVDAATIRGRVEVAPIMTLLGGEMSFSAAAGVWAIEYADHLVQVVSDRRMILVDGTLLEVQDPPIASPTGIAVSMGFLDRHILAPFGFHLQTMAEGFAILPGVRIGDPVFIRATAADFNATTTLVLVLSEAAPVTLNSETPGTVSVSFTEHSPQLDTSIPLRSRRVKSISTNTDRLDIELADEVGMLASHVLEGPDRLVLELGKVKATPTPQPAQVIRHRGRSSIVIDPGHGGDDTGAIADSGLTEKNLTLAIARRIAQTLTARGYETRLTRDGDTSRALTDRTALANRLEARLFVSLHANSSTVASVRGAETYYMSLDDRASDAAAQSTADLENRAGGNAPPGSSTLDLILWDMAQSDVLNESARLALKVQGRLNALLGLKDRGVKQAPFVVLTGATMPAVLIEVGFLSNVEERERLASPDHQQELAGAIASGIEDFLGRS
jgi:N-acetylmuramoyl-L-alanine amidase